MAETIGDRIKAVRGELTQPAFAARLNVTKDTIGKYERGERRPEADVLARVHEILGVNINWLLTGIGPMYQSDQASSSQPPATPAAMIAPDLYGRVLEAISTVYNELGWGITLRQLGAEASRIATEIAADGLAPEDVPGAVRGAAAMLRRQLRDAQANPAASSSRKDSA